VAPKLHVTSKIVYFRLWKLRGEMKKIIMLGGGGFASEVLAILSILLTRIRMMLSCQSGMFMMVEAKTLEN